MTDKKDERGIGQRYVAAVSSMQNPPKNAKADTGRFGYTYATLDCVLDVVKPALKENGLALCQGWAGDGEAWVLETGVTDGVEFMWLDKRPIYPNADPQKQGASETYARRYALVTAFGLAAIEDTDAANAKPDGRERLIEVCRRYAEATGSDAKEVMKQAAQLEGFAKTPEGYQVAIDHFEKLLGQ